MINTVTNTNSNGSGHYFKYVLLFHTFFSPSYDGSFMKNRLYQRETPKRCFLEETGNGWVLRNAEYGCCIIDPFVMVECIVPELLLCVWLVSFPGQKQLCKC